MLLNSTQARKIFDKYSFLIEGRDVIAVGKAARLFGEDEVLNAITERESREGCIIYCFEDGEQHMFLSYEGLCLVISYCNRQEIINRDKMIFGNKPPSVKDEEWHEVKENSKVISFEERRRRA